MTQLTDAFQPICQEVQTKLKGALRGFFGGMVRLPTAKAGDILYRFMLNDMIRLVKMGHPA